MTTLDELECLERSATPAPWAEFCESGDWWVERAEADGSPTGGFVCLSDTDRGGLSTPPWERQSDIDLTVAARNALPALLRVARAARRAAFGPTRDEFAALAELRAALAELEQ